MDDTGRKAGLHRRILAKLGAGVAVMAAAIRTRPAAAMTPNGARRKTRPAARSQARASAARPRSGRGTSVIAPQGVAEEPARRQAAQQQQAVRLVGPIALPAP